MLEVPRTVTPLALGAIRPLIEAAFAGLGRPLSALEAVNFAALVAIETARGQSVQNGNVGNITAGPTYTGPVWRPPWFQDEAHPLHAVMLAGKAPSAFRAYDSLAAGAKDFAQLLLSEKYAPLVRAANQPSADVFRVALSERYSPDYKNPKSTATLEALQREFGLNVAAGSAGLASLLLLGVGVWAWLRSRPRPRRSHR
jgi:hypothetical protein